MFFHCEITGGVARKTSESSESAFFAADRLPELSLSRVLPSQIQAFFQAVYAGKTEAQYD
ncbi:MAG: hypothetical protein BWX48_03242 [Verrucomicrobia bacterium ADurb.Bin006]|jgi:hypothetical protein|nr:MAG: hypothetical protein BWX48_03242 [Verrucomicrobia bacterium ADurb.Bin006]